MKLSLTKVLVIAFSIIGALILFLVIFGEARQPDTFLNDMVAKVFNVNLTPETPMPDVLSKILLAVLVAVHVGVLLFLITYKESEPVMAQVRKSQPEAKQSAIPQQEQAQSQANQQVSSQQQFQQQKKKKRR